MAAQRKVYQFKITLRGIRPPIWRRIQVLDTATFWDLHVAIQDVMGWYGLHLHTFEIMNPRTNRVEEVGVPDEEFPSILPFRTGWKTKLSRYFSPENSKSLYTYDFTDDWRHTVALEKILSPEEGETYPRCTGGKRAAPPESCGGIHVYSEILNEIGDKKLFDSEHFDIAEIEFSDPHLKLENLYSDEAYRPTARHDEFEPAYIGDYSKIINDFREFIRKGKIGKLDAEGQRIARAFADHEALLERSDRMHRKFNSVEELIAHISMHAIVETEIETKKPFESYQFYKAMLRKKVEKHEIIHMIGSIQMPITVESLIRKQPFDIEKYKNLLSTCTFKKPSEIPAVLGKEFKIGN